MLVKYLISLTKRNNFIQSSRPPSQISQLWMLYGIFFWAWVMQGCIFFLHSLFFEKLMGPFFQFFWASSNSPQLFSAVRVFWPDCTSLLDHARGAFFVNLMFWIFGFEVFSPLVHYMLYCALFLSTLYSGPYDFSLYFWEIFAYLWPFCPILHGFLCYEIPLMGSARLFIYQNARGFFHDHLFWNSVLDLYSQFSISGCRVLFHQVLFLDTSYSGP